MIARISLLFAVAAVVFLSFPSRASAQDPAEVQQHFEAGRYDQVISAATPGADPAILFMAAQSHQRRGARDAALEIYGRLAERPDGDPWRLIGVSAQQLLSNQVDAADASAQQAVQAGGGLPEAHYQLGLVLAQRQAWNEAAAAFDQAAQLAPSYAYAYYYGGLMHSRAKRADQMAVHFEQFLKLAPEAPERPEVLQIMRTVRGR